MEHLCYLCGEPITTGQLVTGDHVVPVVFLGKKQPKLPGFDYAGRIPTHQACNNQFSDEAFFRQSIHLVELVQSRQMHGVLQSSEYAGIEIVPLTPDQAPTFTNREFRRFSFIDAREIDTETLKNPAFYEDKKKVNLLRIAVQAAISVKAKSAAALLVKRKLRRVPSFWRIYASPFELEGSPDLCKYFGLEKPFGPTTRASLRQVRPDEWLVVYQHRSLLTFLLFAFHDAELEPRQVLDTPGCEIHAYSGSTLNSLIGHQWHMV